MTATERAIGHSTDRKAVELDLVNESAMKTASRDSYSAQQGESTPDEDLGYIVLFASADDGDDVAKVKKTFECTLCKKRYERLDHVKRHVESHENARPFKCASCARRFNRRDLLARHQQIHDARDTIVQGKGRRSERVIQACQACTAAKTKCDDRRPCRRCEKRRVSCVDTPPTRRAALLSTDGLYGSTMEIPSPNNTSEDLLNAQNDQMGIQDVILGGNMASESSNLPTQHPHELEQTMQMQPDLADEIPQFEDLNQNPMIDDVMWENMAWDNINFQADLAHIYQDMDFHFDDELPSIHAESWLSFDQPRDNQQNQVQASSNSSSLRNPTANVSRSHLVTGGHEAFKKSPWLWTPSKQDHAYSSQSQLAISDEANIMDSPEISSPGGPLKQPLPSISDIGARDEMLQTVIKFSKSALKIRSFPSHNLLNVLMQAFFVKDSNSIDSWLHMATFSPNKCRTELLAGLISAGSTLFAIPNIWKMGLALQDVVKLAICDALDHDNTLARDLQTHQTFLVWMDVGLWSGFRRKMEIAEGFAHNLPTMLRRAGAFQQSYYAASPVPEITDEGPNLRQKWLKWVEVESTKRLTFRIFINEMRTSIAFVRNPVFSGMELTLTLPASRDLWDAPSADEWKRLFIGKKRRVTTFTLLDGQHDPLLLERDGDFIDLQLSAHIILYAFWGRIWSLADSQTFHQRGPPSSKRATTQLWLEAQHQELYDSLKSVKEKLERMNALSPEALLLCEVLMMSLHASFADIQSFAGRFGERESKHALPQLCEWATRPSSHVAKWHAGQVLRTARLLPPTSLRGFVAIAVYHACLLLWVSTWLLKKSSAPSRASPAPEHDGRVHFDLLNANNPSEQLYSAQWVTLDGPEDSQVRSYLDTGEGVPALQLAGQVARLADTATIPAVMKEIFKLNFPAQGHPLPPLLENLINLMDELSQP